MRCVSSRRSLTSRRPWTYRSTLLRLPKTDTTGRGSVTPFGSLSMKLALTDGSISSTAMAKAPWTDAALYAAAQRFVEQCLRTDGSLFSPGEAIWTLENLREAAERLLSDDIRKLDYMTKLKD